MRKILLICFLIVLVLLISQRKSPTQSADPSAFPVNPFGVMFSNANLVPQAKDLGVSYYRPNAVLVENWQGVCKECDEALKSGLKLVLTVRNNGGHQTPTTPPNDYDSYKSNLGKILDNYQPAVLVVENEENSKALFYNGTVSDYHQELRIACQIAHQKGIKCTNGGLVSSLVAGLVAQSYKDLGNTNKANEYIQRTVGDKPSNQLWNNSKLKEQITRGKELLAGYKEAGADYINFHWYISDPSALEEAVNYLQNTAGIPAITNEIGQQKNEDPNQVTKVMQKISDLKIPIAVWFSVDMPGYGEARSLVNPDGSFRPNGEAFKNFIKNNF